MNKSYQIFVILHSIRSAHNVGSIFRTADAAGVDKIYLCGYTPTPETSDKGQAISKISKTALGAEKTVAWEQYKQTWRLLEKLKKDGVKIVALEQDKKAIDYRKFKIPLRNGVPEWSSLVLVLGNEVDGLSKEILKYADKIIAIPMYGQKESLNVSVAAGIALFKIIDAE